MKKRSVTAFDAADYLKTEEDMAAYLAAASEDGDLKVLMSAMGDVIRARSVSKIAREAGLTREGIYKAFSVGGNPSFATVMKVANALHLDVAFQARTNQSRGRAAQSRKAHARTTRRTDLRASSKVGKG